MKKLYAVKCADRTTGETKWCVVSAASKNDALRTAEGLGYFTSDTVEEVAETSTTPAPTTQTGKQPSAPLALQLAGEQQPSVLPPGCYGNPIDVKLHPSCAVEVLSRVLLIVVWCVAGLLSLGALGGILIILDQGF